MRTFYVVKFTLIISIIVSASFVFAQTDVCLYEGTEKEIEADIVATQTYSFEVLSSATVTNGSMIIEFDVWHPKREQFKAVVTHPNGTTSVTIADISIAGDLGNTSGSGYGTPAKYTVYDGGANTWGSGSDDLPGDYSPANSLSAFDGMSTAGTWTISFTDKNGSFDNRGYVRNVYLKFDLENSCTAPTTAPSGLSIDNVSSYTVDLSWTNGNGDNVLVIAHKTADSSIIPENGTTYTADTVFGAGQELRTLDNVCDYSGNFVVYKGTGTSAKITGLTSGLSYTFNVYTADGTCFNTTAESDSQLLPCPSDSDPVKPVPSQFRTCGSDSGTEISDAGTLSFDIEVSGLSTPLDVDVNGLREVKVFLKNGSGEDLSLYSCTLTSPTAKASTTIFSSGTFDSGVSSAEVTFRESSRLNPPSSSAVKPYNIGVYRIQTADDFTTQFDGLTNPNGTWTITFTETAGSTLDDIQLDYIELEFGPSFPETDVSSSGANCDNAYELTIGNYVSSNSNADSDDGNQPTRHTTCGDGISGCGCWNASYDEAQFLKFTATSTYFSMSLSGIQASSGDIQVIVVEGNPTPCSGSGNWTVVTCPESSYENTANTLDGRSHTGNGSVENFDLSMDNAVIGNTYYIIIDGNSAATADYYINVTDGVAKATVLPITLISFEGKKDDFGVELFWQTSSELNNDYFTLEKSLDAINYYPIAIVDGAGNSTRNLYYSYLDSEKLEGNAYYRLKQTDTDGSYTYSHIINVSENDQKREIDFDVYYSKESNSFVIELVSDSEGRLDYNIINTLGNKLMYGQESYYSGYNEIIVPLKIHKSGLYLMNIKVGDYYVSKKLLIP